MGSHPLAFRALVLLAGCLVFVASALASAALAVPASEAAADEPTETPTVTYTATPAGPQFSIQAIRKYLGSAGGSLSYVCDPALGTYTTQYDCTIAWSATGGWVEIEIAMKWKNGGTHTIYDTENATTSPRIHIYGINPTQKGGRRGYPSCSNYLATQDDWAAASWSFNGTNYQRWGLEVCPSAGNTTLHISWSSVTRYPVTSTPTATPTSTDTPTPTDTPTDTPTPTPTVATWYVGNRHDDSYGAKADIAAPTSLAIQQGGEANWVSIPQPYWVQAGWRYYLGWSTPRMFLEHLGPVVGYGIREPQEQAWGTVQQFRVEWTSDTLWCAWIGDEYSDCQEVAPAPAQVQAYSDLHYDNQNELNTEFSEVYYRDAQGQWFLLDEGLWREDAPYLVDKIQPWHFRNHGPN
jgi:hypothetical protein